MAAYTGSLGIEDLLAVQHQSAADFGMDTVQQVLQNDIDAHNQIVDEMMDELAETSEDRQRIYGASQGGEMTEVDEYGRGPTQQPTHGDTVGFPLRLFQYGIGWNRAFALQATPADFAKAVRAGEKAHLRAIQTQVKYAVFRSSNYTFRDHLVDRVGLSVKRLVNADGMIIPDGPNGESYDGSTHTHYSAEAALSNSGLLAAVNTVVEHGHGGMVRMAINRADESSVMALTDAKQYVDARLTLTEGDPRMQLDYTRIDNRAVGIFGAAEVWVKPWVPANYAFIWDAGDEDKPMVFRVPEQEALRGLRIAAELEAYPLYADYMEAWFGVGVWTRTNGAVHFFNGGAYTDPF